MLGCKGNARSNVISQATQLEHNDFTAISEQWVYVIELRKLIDISEKFKVISPASKTCRRGCFRVYKRGRGVSTDFGKG